MVRKHTSIEEKRMKKEEETAEAGGELIHFADVGALMAAMVDFLDILYPDAKRAIESCGPSRCEGAYWQTAAKRAKGELRKPPIAWFRTTLRKGLEWTPEEIRLHFNAQRELELREMEQSNDVTKERIARQERERDAVSDAAATTGPPDASETILAAGPSSSAHNG